MRRLHALELLLPLGVEAVESLAQLLLVLGEALRQLIQDKLGVGVRGAVAVLKPGEVVVGGLVLHDWTAWKGITGSPNSHRENSRISQPDPIASSIDGVWMQSRFRTQKGR